jgi:hypothetical protein
MQAGFKEFHLCRLICNTSSRAQSRRTTVAYRPQTILLIGIAATLPLMAIAVLLLNTSITSRVVTTQRTNETLARFP